MALTLTLTPAGRAALVNAKADGTNAVRVDRIGLTATAFVSGQALPNEIKRLATLAGGATAKNTLHVTITDATPGEVYSVRGFGWYLADGTLLGSYGQAAVIVEKSAQSTLLLATDVQFADIDATQIVFGDTTFNNPASTVDTLGVLKLASDDDAITGNDGQRAVTPRSLLAALNARLGNGAPTTFAKNLLSVATAAAFRLALGIKGAALKDEGPGNGLDADTLDGQHGDYYRAWGNLTGKPDTFAPSAHKHPWSDITNPPEPSTRWPTWGEVTAKPDMFTPAPHSHAWSDINNPPMQTQRWPAWNEVTAKPATYAPSAHTHAISDVTNLQTALDAKAPTQSPLFQGQVIVVNNAFRASGWNGANTDGVMFFGKDDSYIFKNNGTFVFKNEQGGYAANLNAGGTIFTSGNFNPANPVPTTGLLQVGNTATVYATLRCDGMLATNGGAFYPIVRANTATNSNGTKLTTGLLPSIDAIAPAGYEHQAPLIVGNGGNPSASAVMAFLRDGLYGGFLGIDTDNALKWGGWSQRPARRVLHERIRDAVLDGTTSVEDLRIAGNPAWHHGAASFNTDGNGWMRFPNGFILQWGTYLSGAPWNEGSGPTLGFPMAFPHACLSVQLTDYLNNVGGAGWSQYDNTAQITGWDRVGFSTFIQFPGGANANRWCGMTYFAMGF